jgi:hypothetical protein
MDRRQLGARSRGVGTRDDAVTDARAMAFDAIE